MKRWDIDDGYGSVQLHDTDISLRAPNTWVSEDEGGAWVDWYDVRDLFEELANKLQDGGDRQEVIDTLRKEAK